MNDIYVLMSGMTKEQMFRLRLINGFNFAPIVADAIVDLSKDFFQNDNSGVRTGQILYLAISDEEGPNELMLKGITVIAPFKKETNKNGLFPQSKFSIEKHGVICPAGCRTMVWNHNKKTKKITFFFNKKDCGSCKLKQKCTVQKRRTIAISEHYELLKKAKEYNKTDDFKEDMKQRAHIEPKQGEMKRYHGLQRAKYWGLPKMNIQATISAIVVNVKRLVTVNSCGYRWGS